MPTPRRKLAIALLSLCICGSGHGAARPAGADGIGELSGRVVDDADDTAVVGASVQAAQVDGQVAVSTVSDRDGKYRIPGLPAGAKFMVTYTKQGYVADAHSVEVTAVQDGRIWKQNGDRAYYERKAAKINAIVAEASPDRQQQVWDEEFRAVAKTSIKASAKGWIARAMLSGAPDSIRKSSLFEAYASADPAVLKRLDRMSEHPEQVEVMLIKEVETAVAMDASDGGDSQSIMSKKKPVKTAK